MNSTSDQNDNLGMSVSFTRSPAKHGPYYIFQIPNNLIKSGEINPDYLYKIIVIPLKKKEE